MASSYSAQEVITGALKWAKMIAETNKYTYKRWGSNPDTHKCPICHPGSGNGWNCIGFVTACYYHGGGLRGNLECYCGGLGPDDWNNTDPSTTKFNNRNGPGWKKINSNRIKATDSNIKKQCNPGDVLVLYKTKAGNSYIHTAMYYGWSTKSNTALIAESSSGNPNGTKVQYCRKNRHSDWYMNIYRFVGPGSSKNKKPYTNSNISVPKTVASGKPVLQKIKKASSAKEVRDGAVSFAKAVAKDNTFHYGYGQYSHRNGCYFCGTQGAKKGHGIVDWQYTYCCNPFVTACYAHGGGDKRALKDCSEGHSYCWDRRPPATRWMKLRNPSINDLQAGDVMISGTHVKLYIGNKQVAEASHSDDNKRGSSSWNSSIHIGPCRSVGSFVCYRYIGNGGAWICTLSNSGQTSSTDSAATGEITDDGRGISLEQEISKLWSSQNYKFIQDEKEDDNPIKLQFKDSIQKALDTQFSLNDKNGIVPVSAAVPENLFGDSIKEFNKLNYDRNKLSRMKNTAQSSLLSYPNYVEAPTIVLDFNGIKIGGYGNKGDLYPNYITSMQVNKINGEINTYTFNLTYQVRPGEDPNFIDKLISRVGYTNPFKVLYGDSNYPSGYFKEESAIITDVKHNEDASAYKINYTISALSAIGASTGSSQTYSNTYAKPSDMIYKLLYDSGETSESLLSIFPGMKNRSIVANKNIIPNTDNFVNIGGMKNASPLAYLNHLVSCMSNESSSFFLTFQDNYDNDLGGSYFKITEVKKIKSSEHFTSSDIVYTLDIGYPSENNITNFQISNNEYWGLVYKFAGNIPTYEYGVDNNGDIYSNRVNPLVINEKYSRSNIIDGNWWKNLTEFPISAKVTLKGLVTPAILMSYINVNAVFYGQKDIASGLYVVTDEVDRISGSGYTTELTLLRVSE